MYTVLPIPQFARVYKRLTEQIQNQVDKTIDLLILDPLHPSLRTHKRKDDKTVWQARVSRSYRLLFQMEGSVITLLSVFLHEK